MASGLQRFSATQVCEIITGDDGEVDFMCPGSDHELDAFELTDLQEDGNRQDTGVLDDLEGKNMDTEPQLPGSYIATNDQCVQCSKL